MTGIVFVSFIAFVFLALFGILRGIIPTVTRANHKINTPSGIDRMEMVGIGGIKQALYFRGQSKDNPVILFLHGGPGFANIPFIHKFQYDWEKEFTLVNWDQRNSGKTFAANDPETVRDTLTVERTVADAHEITQYIKQKLGKEKIVIMGQSWGSVLGTILIQKYPDDYSMYIGTGQAINGVEGERIFYERTLETAREAGNQKSIDALIALAPYPPQTFDESIFKKADEVRKYQVKNKPAILASLNLLSPVFSTPYYSIGEILSFIKGMSKPQYQIGLWRFSFEYNAHNYGTGYKIPVYYIQGENDWQTPYPLAKAFFEEISAPEKKFFSIPNAGHFIHLDNKEELTRVMVEEIRPLLGKASMDYTIKQAHDSDNLSIAKALAFSFEKDISIINKNVEKIARIFESGIETSCFYVAEQNEEIIGAIACTDCTTGRALKATKSDCKTQLGFFRGTIAFKALCSELMRPLSYPETTGYIDVVGVLQKARGRGIAKAMLRKVIESNPQYDEFILETDSSNTSAIKCYTDFGFVEFSRVPIVRFFKRSRVFMRYTNRREACIDNKIRSC